MKALAASILPLTFALLAAGCAAAPDEELGATDDALTTLTAQGCATPAVTTVPKKDAQNRPIEGTAKTTITGCVVGKANENGTSTVNRGGALLGNNAKLAGITDPQGVKLFERFSPVGGPSGSLDSAAGQVQLVDVTLKADQSPKGQVRITRKRNTDGTYSLSLTNNKAIVATVLFFSVTVIEKNNLNLQVTLRPEANGMTVGGTSEIELEQAPEQAAQASQLVRDLFSWLTTEMAR